MSFPEPLQKLIDEFSRFPGIGPKTAQRLSFFLLSRPREEAAALARAILEAKDKLFFCSLCGCLTEKDPCRYCSDPRRDQKLFCVVQEPRDVLRLEQTGHYHGLYHVLHGALSPLDGLGPEELRLPQLLQRLVEKEAEELIVATNPNVEGDATAAYIASLVKPLNIKVTRIAFGLPVGGDLEYADDLTLSRALEGRREM
ncbi:MAG: recombination protein RecR [Firmicutes bacterium]|jgi:recombination protein RecR|nr:recombination protein RecR [Bacillota bacterium]HPU01593.1 recombination mediator RecR [Bacillota bacterium]